jgi:hypothetical protein
VSLAGGRLLVLGGLDNVGLVAEASRDEGVGESPNGIQLHTLSRHSTVRVVTAPG